MSFSDSSGKDNKYVKYDCNSSAGLTAFACQLSLEYDIMLRSSHSLIIIPCFTGFVKGFLKKFSCPGGKKLPQCRAAIDKTAL